jgi:hypothetical protein
MMMPSVRGRTKERVAFAYIVRWETELENEIDPRQEKKKGDQRNVSFRETRRTHQLGESIDER